MVGAGSNIHSLDQRIRRLLQSWCLGLEPPQWVWKRIKAELIGKGKTVSTKQIQGDKDEV
jgi:hypothetical protein